MRDFPASHVWLLAGKQIFFHKMLDPSCLLLLELPCVKSLPLPFLPHGTVSVCFSCPNIFLGPLHQGSDPGFPTITVQGIFHLVHEKRSVAVFMKPPMEHHDWWCPYIAKLVSNGVYGKYQYEPPTLRPDENARRSLQCSNLFSSGPQPITVLRDIQVCRWITSKLVCSIFSREHQCFHHMSASAREDLLA